MNRGGYNPRRGAEKHVKLVLTLAPAEKAAIVDAANGAPSVSAWVLARCAPPTRDPRVDPRAGDVVWWDDCKLSVQVDAVTNNGVYADGPGWSFCLLTEWRERTASADVLRVAP